MSNFYCKFCGRKYSSPATLSIGACHKSPTKRHQIYQGPEAKVYACMHCGHRRRTIADLTAGQCPKNPRSKWHEPA